MNKGIVVQVSGPVIDVEFAEGHLPKLREALEVTVEGERRVMEVSQLIGGNTVRCIMMSQSEGLARGAIATAMGRGISVPVGNVTIGRMFNVLGDPIDGGDDIPPLLRGEIN